MTWTHFLHRRRWHQERARELESYLEMETSEGLARGLAESSARVQAERKLGNRTRILEEIYTMNTVGWWDRLLQDVRFSFRLTRRAPGFTTVTILVLALGLGASTAVFSTVDAVLLQPLPFPRPDRIVLPLRQAPPTVNLGFDVIQFSEPGFEALRASRAYSSVGAFEPGTFNLTGAGQPRRLDGVLASVGFWASLGVKPELGRVFSAEEDRPGHEHVVVLSDAVWRGEFHADPAVLGRAVALSGADYTVVGVMPPGFAFPRASSMPPVFNFPSQTQLWVPLAPVPPKPLDPDLLALVARLAPGVSVVQAQAAAAQFTHARELKYPRGKGWFNLQVAPLAQQLERRAQRPILLLLGAVLVLLLIACANIASLLLARGLARAHEFNLRTALGAGPARLLRQLLTESVLLALAGGLCGLALAQAAVAAVRHWGPAGIPRLQTLSLDGRALAFAFGLSMLAGVVFGLAPAWEAARQRRRAGIHSASRQGVAARRSRLRRALLLIEVGLATVLLIAAGLLVRSFGLLLQAPTGFHSAQAASFELSLPSSTYPTQPEQVRFYHDVLTRLRQMPGVDAAGLTATTPMAGAANGTAIRIPGRAAAVGAKPARGFASYTVISPGYFAAAGTPLLRGRDFALTDIAASPVVTIISASMAARFWPGQNPIGRQVGPAASSLALATIIGIAPDVKRISLRDKPSPEMYVLYNQHPWPSLATMDVVVRSRDGAQPTAAALAATVHQVDPQVPLANFTTLSGLVQRSLAPYDFLMALLLGFALLAMLAATVGLYSVTAYDVQRRSPEIAVRMVLGARPEGIFSMVLREAAALAGAGVLLGVAAAWLLMRLMESLLYGVAATDPLTFAAAAILLLAVALLAAYLPARRATRLDPLLALRQE